MLCKLVIAAYCFILLCFLIKNNNVFVLVLKSERRVDKQNRQLSFLVKRDTKIANLKVKVHEKKSFLFTKCKSQIILIKKNGLNVEHFR